MWVWLTWVLHRTRLQVVGGTDPDYQMCAWMPPEVPTLPSDGARFDMRRPSKLSGHTGPISAVALDSTCAPMQSMRIGGWFQCECEEHW